jgi:hypothetical protein
MSSIIRATTTSGLQIAPDNSGSLQFQTNGTTAAVAIDTSQNLQFNSGYGSVATAYGCRAWVNFNGTGTVAIRGSGNVTSITDNNTGDYTVNFTNAMPDANYSYLGNCNDASNLSARNCVSASGTWFVTSSLRINCIFTGTGTPTDSGSTTIAVFR